MTESSIRNMDDRLIAILRRPDGGTDYIMGSGPNRQILHDCDPQFEQKFDEYLVETYQMLVENAENVKKK